MYKLTVEIEKSDHDGYCSGEECEYNSIIVTKTLSIVEVGPIFTPLFKSLKRITTEKGETFLDLYQGETKIDLCVDEFFKDETELNCSGSGYCHLSDNCVKKELERHDYRINLISVEVI